MVKRRDVIYRARKPCVMVSLPVGSLNVTISCSSFEYSSIVSIYLHNCTCHKLPRRVEAEVSVVQNLLRPWSYKILLWLQLSTKQLIAKLLEVTFSQVCAILSMGGEVWYQVPFGVVGNSSTRTLLGGG